MTRESKRVFLLFFSSCLGAVLVAATLNMAVRPEPAAADKPVEVGHQLMKRYGCFTCHKLDGFGSSVGPVLDDVGDRRDADWISRWVTNPYALKSNSRMPAFFYLPENDIRTIAEFLSRQKSAEQKAP